MSGTDPKFWKDKSVFLTGHTGFKGGWLSTWLNELGALVSGYALEPTTTPSYFELCSLSQRINSHIGDIRDVDAVIGSMRMAQPEIVFHLAAQPLVNRSYREAAATFATNVIGTANFLEAVKTTASVQAVVIITSDKCYENNDWAWGYRESDALGGHDPYSASKACAELVCNAYRRSFFQTIDRTLPIATARAGNVIGGGDWSEDRIVPDAVKAFSTGVPLLLRNPRAVRPWQHVLEPLAGYLLLAEHLYHEGGQYAGAWNFGPEDIDAVPVSTLADSMVHSWGGGASWRGSEPNCQLHESTYLKLDCSKARTLLKWRPCLRVGDAVRMAFEWYGEYYLKGSADLYETSCSQIREYQRRLTETH
jgi:CDP-glucose 4,6-dehydratase